MALKFENRDGVRVAFHECSFRKTSGSIGKSFNAIRVIKEGPNYRVDKTSAVAGAWMPWEPVTDRPFKTMAEAKKAANRYATSCKRTSK